MKLSTMAAILCGFAAIRAAQTVTNRRSFEVASIKASPLTEGTDSDFNPGRLWMQGTLKAMIRVAYGVSSDRIEGGPKWLDGDHYEINAKAEGPAETTNCVRCSEVCLPNASVYSSTG